MPRPITRVLAVLELLQSHAQMSGADLAGRLDVDGRTLRRYIAMLEEMGIPITAEYGRHGGYRLVPRFQLPPVMFTHHQTQGPSLRPISLRGVGFFARAPGLANVPAKPRRL